MFVYSTKSETMLKECDVRLQKIFRELLKTYDHTIVCGHRGKTAQNDAFYSRPQRSKLPYPKSKHNRFPSYAIDAAPYPIDWYDLERFKDMAKKVKIIAINFSIRIRWGGDFTTFKDLAHWELLD